MRSRRCGIARARATSSTARAREAWRVAAHLQRQLDLRRDRGRDDLGLGVLGDVADRGGQLAGAARYRVDAGDLDAALDLAAVEVRDEAAGGSEEGRLAAGGAAGQEDELAGGQVERSTLRRAGRPALG